jgi:dienelactone hydrolase
MKQYKIRSSFESLPVEIFWYPAKQMNSPTIILLKGLYGLHNPYSTTSWDSDIIQSCNKKYNIVCINTARKKDVVGDGSPREIFDGKTFKQECDDIQRVYQYLLENKIFHSRHGFHVIANSFGGTTLLGAPEVLKNTSSVIMIGSGCGKSKYTTKPLLQTLFDEEKLLTPLRSYKGVFGFIRGSDDTIVPKESQDKIIKNAVSASICMTYTIRGAQHDLTSSLNASVINRTNILLSIVDQAVSLTYTVQKVD